MNFSIQAGYNSRESLVIINTCIKYGLSYQFSTRYIDGTIPIGSVEYCERWIPQSNTIKNFYPKSLRKFLYRKIILSRNNQILKPTFCKEAEKWKGEFKSRVVEKGEVIPENLYYQSQPVKFVQEWRYYIVNGNIITAGWYDGQDEDEPAPKLDFEFSKKVNAAVDFGRLDNGKIALVECHPPFACGWYGDNNEDYALWQYNAWTEYLQNGYKHA